MYADTPPFLVIAFSARSLAASAALAGFRVHVLDRFADQDTRVVAESCQVVTAAGHGFDQGELLEKISGFHARSLAGVVYGSGLEHHYDVLEHVRRHWPLMGNEPEVVRTCKDPSLFFPLLARLGIPFPATMLTPPAVRTPGVWLCKHTGAAGGGHIRAVRDHEQSQIGVYFQKLVPGRALSLTFLADARDAVILGVNETRAQAPEQFDFRYAGACTVNDLPGPDAAMLENFVRTLVRAIGLRGLCGMDVIVDGCGQYHVLEINPRPTATFELYQERHSLFTAHVQACQGHLDYHEKQAGMIAAHRILYADRDFVLPDFSWPVWVSDRPRAGELIHKNEPVCTVHARGGHREEIELLLQERVALLRRKMNLQRLAA